MPRSKQVEKPIEEQAEEPTQGEAPAENEEQELLTFIRPSGTEIQVGNTEDNIAAAEAAGWKLKE